MSWHLKWNKLFLLLKYDSIILTLNELIIIIITFSDAERRVDFLLLSLSHKGAAVDLATNSVFHYVSPMEFQTGVCSVHTSCCKVRNIVFLLIILHCCWRIKLYDTIVYCLGSYADISNSTKQESNEAENVSQPKAPQQVGSSTMAGGSVKEAPPEDTMVPLSPSYMSEAGDAFGNTYQPSSQVTESAFIILF